MDSLNKILKDYRSKDSDELFILKKYLEDKFKQNLNLSYSSNKILIEVKSAAFANVLRMNLVTILNKVNCRRNWGLV